MKENIFSQVSDKFAVSENYSSEMLRQVVWQMFTVRHRPDEGGTKHL
jgi:hypothetical protein